MTKKSVVMIIRIKKIRSMLQTKININIKIKMNNVKLQTKIKVKKKISNRIKVRKLV